jgi:hypothetical protein
VEFEMASIYYGLYRVCVDRIVNAEAIVKDMAMEIDLGEVSGYELVQACQMTDRTLRVCVKVSLEESMELASAKSLLEAGGLVAHYDDGSQKIEHCEFLNVFEEPSLFQPTVDQEPMEDLFAFQHLWPGELGIVINHYAPRIEEEGSYELAKEFLNKVESLGFTFNLGLDGVPYELCRHVYPFR